MTGNGFDAGNGETDGSFVTGNDPNDANVAVDATFNQGGIQHLVTRWGLAAAGRQVLPTG